MKTIWLIIIMTLLALNLYLSRHDFRDLWEWMKRRSRPMPNLGSMPRYENPPKPPFKKGGICFLGGDIELPLNLKDGKRTGRAKNEV